MCTVIYTSLSLEDDLNIPLVRTCRVIFCERSVVINLNWRHFTSFVHRLYYLYCRGEKCMSSLIKISDIFELMKIIVVLTIKTPSRQLEK